MFVKLAARIKRIFAIRTASRSILFICKSVAAVSTQHRIRLVTAGSFKRMILHLIVAGKAGIILPAFCAQ
jgi:hypothetical protein